MLPRNIAFAISAVAHATFAATFAAGHAAETQGEPAPVEMVIELSTLPVATTPTENPPEKADQMPARSHAHPTHHHPYPVPFDHDAHPHDPSAAHPQTPATQAAAEATPAAVTAPEDSAPVRFELPKGSVGTHGHTEAGAGDHDHDHDHAAAIETLPENNVSSPARLVASSPAAYPREARDAQIETDVPVTIVVDENGRVVEAQSASRVGYGLDDAAVRSVRGYRFSPASREGKSVRVRMRWVVQFRLH